MSVIDIRKPSNQTADEPRRGAEPGDSAYLQRVGRRVRAQRTKLGMSRKALSQNSGVSERYLAELERGSGNASLLVLRNVSSAMGLKVDHLTSESSDALADNDVEAMRVPAIAIGQIVLVGLRGAGKSTLGRAAAGRFNVPFVELNDEIERVAGMDVSEIFSRQGEAGYRALERSCLKAVLKAHANVVVATGGGIVTDGRVFEKLTAGCFVVWAKTTPDVLFERARNSIALRDHGLSRQAKREILDFLAAREPMFAKADATVDTTNKESIDAIKELVEIVGKRQQAA